MERDMNQSALPTMCRAGCGFYGSAATDGYCSKCFKDALKRKQDPGQTPATSATPKSMDATVARDRDLVTAVENLVTSGQASCSIDSTPVGPGPQEIEKSDDSQSQSSDGGQGAVTAVEAGNAVEPSTAPQKQKNRCDSCRKRVGLTGFECRCGGMFCATHRYSDMHQCSFDYKALGEKEIRKNNPVVKSEKIVKL